jgi:hypothetical protein
MPQLIENQDGTTTLTINSSELVAVKNAVFARVTGIKQVVQILDGPEVRAVLGFVKSVANS